MGGMEFLLFLFDLNGLYGGFSRSGLILKIFKFGGAKIAALCALRYKVCREAYNNLLCGRIKELEYWQTFIRGFGLAKKISAKLKDGERQDGEEKAVVQKLTQLLTESIREIDSQMLALLVVVKQHSTVALLSDINVERVEELKRREEYQELFGQFEERTYFSYDVKHTKQDKESFEYVLEGLGMTERPGQVVFIDDHRANIRVARRLGMRVIYFKSPRQLRRVLAKMPGLPEGLRRELKGPLSHHRRCGSR